MASNNSTPRLVIKTMSADDSKVNNNTNNGTTTFSSNFDRLRSQSLAANTRKVCLKKYHTT